MRNYQTLAAGAIVLALCAPVAALSQTPAGPVPLASPSPLPTLPPSVSATRPVAGVPQSITLQQAIDLAAAKSPVLAAARANYQITQIPVNLARTAIFPNISGSGTTVHSNRGAVTGGQGFSQQGGISGTSTGLNFTLRQLIYDGGKVIAQIHQARANAVAGLGTYQRDLETLSFNVAQAYYTALAAHAASALEAQVVHQDEVQLALVQAQLRAGVASRVDVATAELPVAQARVALVRAQGLEVSDLAAFANSMGLDADTAVQPMNDTPSNPSQLLVRVQPYDQSLTRALALRPDYQAAEYTVMASQYNVQVQRSGLFPSLNGTANYGTNSTSNNGGNFVPGNSVGLTLSIPIFDQGVTRAQTEQATAQLDLAQAQLDQTRLGVQLAVRQALVGLISAQGQVQETQVELTQARTVLSATQAQYRAGVTTLPLLLNAQVNLTTAQTDQLSAIYNLREAEQTYVYALGESSMNPASTL